MVNGQIEFQNEAGRTAYEYRPRVPVITPGVWLWCVVGGLPVGVAGATVITLLGVTEQVTFTGALAAFAAAGALALFVIARLVTHPRVVLRVTFDVLTGVIEIVRVHARPQDVTFALLDVGGFRTETRAVSGSARCALLLDTVRGDVLPLVQLAGACHPRTGLQDLADRLTMALEVARNEVIAAPPRHAQPAAYQPPTILRPAVPLRHLRSDDDYPGSESPDDAFD